MLCTLIFWQKKKKLNRVKLKVKLSLCLTKHHATKRYYLLKQGPRYEDVWRSEDITTCIINLSTRWRVVVSFTPWPL